MTFGEKLRHTRHDAWIEVIKPTIAKRSVSVWIRHAGNLSAYEAYLKLRT